MPEQVQKVWDPNGQSSGWYTEALESVNPETREILEKYSGIAPDEVIPHCKRVVRIPRHSEEAMLPSKLILPPA